MGVYKSLIETWTYELGLRPPRSSFSGNICFEFSVLCLCSMNTDHGTQGGAPLPGLELGEGVFLELRPPAALLHRALQTTPQLNGESHNFEVVFFICNVSTLYCKVNLHKFIICNHCPPPPPSPPQIAEQSTQLLCYYFAYKLGPDPLGARNKTWSLTIPGPPSFPAYTSNCIASRAFNPLMCVSVIAHTISLQFNMMFCCNN